jgi:DNA-binding response OmpR family regulator
MREMLVDVLSDAGFQILEAATAEAAVPMLHQEEIRVIVTDINLPGRLDGIALAQAARERSPNIPVVFMSGGPSELVEARVLGDASIFLQKPFSFKVLVAEVQRLVTADRPTPDVEHLTWQVSKSSPR